MEALEHKKEVMTAYSRVYKNRTSTKEGGKKKTAES